MAWLERCKERESSPGTCFSLLVMDEGGFKEGKMGR
jgi:hypothetical protein